LADVAFPLFVILGKMILKQRGRDNVKFKLQALMFFIFSHKECREMQNA